MWELNRPNPQDSYYAVRRLDDSAKGMEALRLLFPNAKADQDNLCLFSTSGIHGSYSTIEDYEQDLDADGVTFLVIHPRLVSVRYGNCLPRTTDDFDFLKTLRESSNQVLSVQGMPLHLVNQPKEERLVDAIARSLRSNSAEELHKYVTDCQCGARPSILFRLSDGSNGHSFIDIRCACDCAVYRSSPESNQAIPNMTGHESATIHLCKQVLDAIHTWNIMNSK